MVRGEIEVGMDMVYQTRLKVEMGTLIRKEALSRKSSFWTIIANSHFVWLDHYKNEIKLWPQWLGANLKTNEANLRIQLERSIRDLWIERTSFFYSKYI